MIPVIDVFAGPGGLNEGFAQFRTSDGKAYFKPRLAAEMNSHAVATLRLRKYFRLCLKNNNLEKYLHHLSSKAHLRSESENDENWIAANAEVAKIELGVEADNDKFDRLLHAVLENNDTWVLLGGPPCQAYSNVRRWAFRSDNGFDLSSDHRAHLYTEYLRIIQSFGPSVFVMENVKGVISSNFFDRIIHDLENVRFKELGYKIYSLAVPNSEVSRPQDFIVKSEDYGVPQRRHRVILLGVRHDISRTPSTLQRAYRQSTISDAIGDLPRLRSGFSKQENTDESWYAYVQSAIKEICRDFSFDEVLVGPLEQKSKMIQREKSRTTLGRFLQADGLEFISHHETRGHIALDIKRYAYAALFGQKYGRSPKTSDFPKNLVPMHKNWNSGKFNDRFRVQLKDQPSTTITSHIAKDGHSYIHFDPAQARSLTVREAARLQTFPDNYHFEGPRTEQYRQIGNAVPPFLAMQIAAIIYKLLR